MAATKISQTALAFIIVSISFSFILVLCGIMMLIPKTIKKICEFFKWVRCKKNVDSGTSDNTSHDMEGGNPANI